LTGSGSGTDEFSDSDDTTLGGDYSSSSDNVPTRKMHVEENRKNMGDVKVINNKKKSTHGWDPETKRTFSTIFHLRRNRWSHPVRSISTFKRLIRPDLMMILRWNQSR
jgi:hypothetical protein